MDWWNDPTRHCAGEEYLFGLDDSVSRQTAAWACTRNGGCPVRRQCLRDAIQRADRSLVLGGTTPRQRAALLTAIRSGAPTSEVESLRLALEALVEERVERGGWLGWRRSGQATSRARYVKPDGSQRRDNVAAA